MQPSTIVKKAESLFANLKFRESMKVLLRMTTLLGIPALLVILSGTYMIYRSIETTVDKSWKSRARVQSAALSTRMNDLLTGSLADLHYLAANEVGLAELLKFMDTKLRQTPGRSRYCELVLLSPDFEIFFRIFAVGNRVWMADGVQLADNASLLALYKQSLSLKPGEVAVGPIASLEIGHPSDFTDRRKPQFAMLRMVTPILHESKTRYLVLSLDLSSIKTSLAETLSSVADPVNETGASMYPFCYYFDTMGWVVFQASAGDETQELTTHSVRVNFQGALGKPGLPQAFLPTREHEAYWDMVREVANARSGFSIRANRDLMRDDEVYTEYHPLRLALRAGEPEEVVGGLVFVDKMRHRDFWGMVADNGWLIVLIWCVLLLLFTGYVESIRRTAQRLAAAVGGAEADHFAFSPEPRHEYIFGMLQKTISNMVEGFKGNKRLLGGFMQLVEEYESKSAVSGEPPSSLTKPLYDLERIVGDASSLLEIKDKLLIAASTELDILIEGETGTGKQLVAEAIHRNSQRRDKEFVVINCAELDENLLLDTFFGHVPGAYTGADTERRGAFLTADGGTLFLDEIQSASLKTQQALLHVIAERKFRPLGSDTELNVDFRLIGAANTNLRELVAEGRFREDLYYRINVIYLYIPPLRERKGDIASLVARFLCESGARFRDAPRQFSKGALSKLETYDWPGNVRELKNCIFSAAALSPHSILQAEDIVFGSSGFVEQATQPEGEAPEGKCAEAAETTRTAPPSLQGPTEPPSWECNDRQRGAAAFFLRRGRFTRAEYQQAIDATVSSRTLNYDLNDLTEQGLLRRLYRGPATEYALTENGRAFFRAMAGETR